MLVSMLVTRADDFGWSDWGTPEAIERSFAAIGVVPPWRALDGAAMWPRSGGS